jgi:hypothetical protein
MSAMSGVKYPSGAKKHFMVQDSEFKARNSGFPAALQNSITPALHYSSLPGLPGPAGSPAGFEVQNHQ